MFLDELAAQSGMKPGRVALALIILFSLLGLQVWQTAFKRDDWPLSSFPMYSMRQAAIASRPLLVAVTERGEIPLDPAYTSPLGGARLRRVLRTQGTSKMRQLARNVCDNIRRTGKPAELSAIRLYDVSWRIRRDLHGIGGKQRLTASTPVFCPEQAEQMARERSGEAAPLDALGAAPDDIVIELERANLKGSVSIVGDRYASLGQALYFENQSLPEKAAQVKAASATLEFQAPAGDYWLWVRGKSSKGKGHDSVWIQLNDAITDSVPPSRAEFGNFRDVFPADAYAWSSRSPVSKPARVQLANAGVQRLRITLHQGPLTLDQLVLTHHWPERPIHTRPLRKGP